MKKPPLLAVLFLFVCVFGQNKDTGKCFQCPLFGFYVRIPPFPDIQMCTIYDSSKRICVLLVCVFGQNKDTGKCFQCPLFGFYVRIPPFPDIQMCTIYDSSKRICVLLLFVFARFCMVLFWMLSSHVREDLSFLSIPSTYTGIVIVCYQTCRTKKWFISPWIFVRVCISSIPSSRSTIICMSLSFSIVCPFYWLILS